MPLWHRALTQRALLFQISTWCFDVLWWKGGRLGNGKLNWIEPAVWWQWFFSCVSPLCSWMTLAVCGVLFLDEDGRGTNWCSHAASNCHIQKNPFLWWIKHSGIQSLFLYLSLIIRSTCHWTQHSRFMRLEDLAAKSPPAFPYLQSPPSLS